MPEEPNHNDEVENSDDDEYRFKPEDVASPMRTKTSKTDDENEEPSNNKHAGANVSYDMSIINQKLEEMEHRILKKMREVKDN